MGFFIRSRAANSAVLGPIWPNFELIRDVMGVLVTCKYEEDPLKNEGARVLTTFFPIITLWLPWKPVVASGRISNSFKLFYVSSLPANMKRIQSKIEEKI